MFSNTVIAGIIDEIEGSAWELISTDESSKFIAQNNEVEIN